MKLRVMGALAAVIAATSLSGCSSVVEGATQQILVDTDPAGADCVFERNGRVIARIPQTPGGTTIRKTKDDITVRCDKFGYQPMTYLNHSGLAAAVFGNIILGGAIGVASDFASGAANKYDGTVTMTLTPALSTAPPPSPYLPPQPPTTRLPPLPPLDPPIPAWLTQ